MYVALPSFVRWLGRRSLVAANKTSVPLAMGSVLVFSMRVVFGLSTSTSSLLLLLMVCFWMKPEGWSLPLSVSVTRFSPLSAPHPRKTSSLLWSSEFWRPLPCVPLDGVTCKTGTGRCGWPCGEQKCWLCCHLPCAEAHHQQQKERGSGGQETKDNPHTTLH